MRIVRPSLALGLLVAGAAWLPAAAQVPLAVASDGRAAPGAAVVASIRAGAKVRVGATRGPDVLVTLEGWVDASRLAGKRDSFPASIGGTGTLRLRATPSLEGAILAEFRSGVGVMMAERQGTWAHVTRGVWVPSSALGRASAASQPAATTAPQGPASASETPPPPGAMSATHPVKVLASPNGSPIADLAQGAIVQPVARDRGWIRVRVEGWVQERDLAVADSSLGAALTASDLRANPVGTRGRVVRWEVQVLSLQFADPLRKDMAQDEPYLIARGPGAENALLYLAVPPSLLSDVKGIAPLTTVIITARVRTGRSEPVGTPILDLQSIAKR